MGYPVGGFVFYDEDGNGTRDSDEHVRVPGVIVTVEGRTAQSSRDGSFTIADVPPGVHTATVRVDSLPAYFSAGAAAKLAVPSSADAAVAIELDLGARPVANRYMAFGDSITVGDGSSDGRGYRDVLQLNLRAYWGRGEVVDEGLGGSKSDVGAARIGASLSRSRPAYALILYGTNDWNIPECRVAPPCATTEHLRSMIRATRGWGAYPIVGTIPPVNPDWVDRNAAARNAWVSRTNEFLRSMAAEERVPVAEIHGAFLSQPNLPPLFSDDKHPSDSGYRLIAQAFLGAITRPHLAGSPAAVLLVPPRLWHGAPTPVDDRAPRASRRSDPRPASGVRFERPVAPSARRPRFCPQRIDARPGTPLRIASPTR